MESWLRLAAAGAAVLCMGALAAPIAYPHGYRGWAHVTSGLVAAESPGAPKYEGLHHIYANAAALEGYRTGRFPEGAVIVFDQFSAVQAGGATSAGERKFVDVMVRDSRRFAATGGWDYAEFVAPDGRRVEEIEADPAKSCDGCHVAHAPGGDRVFTDYRD